MPDQGTQCYEPYKRGPKRKYTEEEKKQRTKESNIRYYYKNRDKILKQRNEKRQQLVSSEVKAA